MCVCSVVSYLIQTLFCFEIAQLAEAVEYTHCFSAEG